MPNGLPLEICMRFAAEALKECSTTCNTKYKLPDRCCDACHDEILAKLRLCTRQSDQYFAPQLYRTIRFTDITLTRRFKTLIKNCVSNPPWIEELVIVLEEEGGDPQGKHPYSFHEPHAYTSQQQQMSYTCSINWRAECFLHSRSSAWSLGQLS
jgi:hypothetical protein